MERGGKERGGKEREDERVEEGRKEFILWGEKLPKKCDFDEILNFWNSWTHPLG